MKLTKEQFNVLANVVIDPQAWADHAEATVGAHAVDLKVERHRAAYEAASSAPDYKTRAEREVAQIRKAN